MSRNPLTADELLEVLEADNEHKSRHDAAKSLGLSYATFNARLYCARERLPDLTKEPEFEVPDLPSEELPIEELTDSQPEGLEWLDEHTYMLQEYSPEEGHTRPMTAFIEQEPSFMKRRD